VCQYIGLFDSVGCFSLDSIEQNIPTLAAFFLFMSVQYNMFFPPTGDISFNPQASWAGSHVGSLVYIMPCLWFHLTFLTVVSRWNYQWRQLQWSPSLVLPWNTEADTMVAEIRNSLSFVNISPTFWDEKYGMHNILYDPKFFKPRLLLPCLKGTVQRNRFFELNIDSEAAQGPPTPCNVFPILHSYLRRYSYSKIDSP